MRLQEKLMRLIPHNITDSWNYWVRNQRALKESNANQLMAPLNFKTCLVHDDAQYPGIYIAERNLRAGDDIRISRERFLEMLPICGQGH
jgi:hypothetical protein